MCELVCPDCGNKMILKLSRYGQFYGCTAWPKYTIRILGKTDGKSTSSGVRGLFFIAMQLLPPARVRWLIESGALLDYLLRRGKLRSGGHGPVRPGSPGSGR